MSILDTLVSWAKTAWGAILGIPGDISGALQKVWQFIGSVDNALTWVVSLPIKGIILNLAFDRQVIEDLLEKMRDAQERQPGWTWLVQIYPVQADLQRAIDALRVWASTMFAQTWKQMYALYYAALNWATYVVGVERQDRIKAVALEHAAMLAAVKAALAEVQQEASSGYNTGSAGRASIMATLLGDIASRTPAVADLVDWLVKGVIDLESVDNPLLRWTIGKVLNEVIAKIGVDQAAGELVAALLGPYAAQPKATDLYGAVDDLAKRVTALEQQWATFMVDGGPEVEQAGEQWKAITSVTADIALLGMMGLSVRDPAAWAAGMADTVGAAGNAAMTGIVDLIGRA